MRGNPTDPEAWAKFASRDLSRAKRMLQDDDIEGGMFHLQQACEKHLKGKLIEKGWKLRQIHDVPELVNEAKAMGVGPSISDETAAMLAVEYIAGRYPSRFSDPEPTLEQVRVCLEEVEKMMAPAL